MFDLRRFSQITLVTFFAFLLCNDFADAQEVRDEYVSDSPADSSNTEKLRRAFRTTYGNFAAKPFLRPLPTIYFITLPEEQVYIERQNEGNFYIEKRIGGFRSGVPSVYSFDQLVREHEAYAKKQNWSLLIREARQREGTGRGLLDFSLQVPGGRQSAFTTIFGKPEVNLRVNGVAQMNVGASVQKSEDPNLPRDQQTRVDPTFDQNLQLNIQGTIGDKLTIQTDWDTERTLDYQNTLNIVYEGYEDEIIKSIEMGNVSLTTGNSLIRGSGALFGIKSVAEMGSLRFTSVVSQQDGESNVETITGGSQERTIEIRPADYSDDQHFFMDFYTRQEFETSMANPQQLSQTLQIADVEVWILRENIQTEEGSKLAVALADMGVNRLSADSYAPPDNRADPFSENLLDQYRDPQTGISASDLNIDDSRNFEEGYFTLLEEGVDYTINKITGYISLQRALGSREVLAVAFNYQGGNGENIEVGEINRGGGDRIFLKMLRPKNVSTDNSLFPLTMRNIYSLGVNNITRESLEIELLYTEDNIARESLPGRGVTMLQDLGLDRVDSQGALQIDNQIDLGTGTLDPQNGLIIFPYLEPFGSRVAEVLQDSPASDEDIERLSYRELYTERQRNAAQSSKNSFYQFRGTSRGGVQENFNLGIALVEGSVRVYANGTELQENIDYQVDYSFGSITILNERYTAPGQDIRIEYENQSLTSIEQKTFTGFRAEYNFTDNITLGGTYFRFSERPLDDKIRLGDEPINNAVIGFDANAQFDAPFITRFIDSLPILQTRESSEVSFSGEFAQLRPGVAETRAVSQAIRNNELFDDEENGLAFIDDFEGSNIKISLLNATRWNLASAPAAVPGYEADISFFEEDDFPGMPISSTQSRIERSDLRSQFAWYTIPRNIASILDGVEFTAESEPVRVTDVFPGRETQNPQEEIITTLDVHYNPTSRGPYNYNSNLRTLLEEDPEKTWGGMTAVIPAGQEDFSQNNIEFLEFWVQPILPNGEMQGGAAIEDYNGTMYIDVGLVTEDVIPNTKLNTEDGLALNPETLILDNPSNTRSAIPANPPPPEGQFSNTNRELEDVGLDGLPNTNGVNNLNEQTVFEEFVNQMREQFGANSPQFAEIASDPSNDDYFFYGEEAVQDLPLHERFHRLLGYNDGNTPIDQSDKRAITNRPNTEGLVNPSAVSLTNAYFQYEVELNPADPSKLEIGSPGTFINDITDPPGSGQQDRWYQVRIPLSEFKRKFGDINDFQNITYIRVWMSGYEKPFTMRFATLEFVGSQWRQDEDINNASDPNAEMRISSLNIEENSNRKPFPYRQPEGAIRAENRASQLQSLQNEQSIVMDVNNLGPGSVQLIKRVYPGGLDMLNYSNMRMFVHGEGYDNRGDAELVMRFGNDLQNNYYEYRQPVTPSDPNFPFQEEFNPANNAQLEEEAAQVWMYDENSMNIVLSAFNQLKQLRDQEQGSAFSEIYEQADILENAVPGAVVAIKGNPSLGRVTEIGMGIRNPFDPENPSGNGTPVLNAQMWLNELRVSGFDNEKGWAANAKSTIKLADFATVNANVTRQTQGFGSLDSRLGQRRVSNEFAYDVNTLFYLDSFIPERFGWNIPVNLSARRSSSIPKYLPNQGDVRFSEFEDAVRSRTDLDEEQQNLLIDRQKKEIETFSDTYAINLSNVSKTNSQNNVARLLLDNTTLNYVYNTTDSRNPQYTFQDNWNFNGSLRYALTLRNVRFIRPFDFIQDVPLLNVLSGLQLGYMPTNLSASVGTQRTYEERKRRRLTGELEQPLQQTHSFTYTTNVGLGYNLTRSISTSIQAQTIFDLTGIATESASRAGIDSTAFDPLPSMSVFRDVISGDKAARRNNYNELYTASWQPRFNQIDFLDWLSYNTRYSGGYRWENSPFGSDLGARISNNLRLDHTMRMDTENLLDRIPFYQNAVEADDAARTERRNTGEAETDTTSYSFGEHLAYFGRKAALAVFSLETIDVTYNNSKASAQSGYAGSSQFFDMFGDQSSPPLGYRLGIFESIGQGNLIANPDGVSTIQLPTNNTYSDNVTVTASLNPLQNVSVDLNWQTQWDRRRSESLSLNPQNEFSSVESASGNISSSIWAFGPGYEKLFRNQLQTAFDGMGSTENIIRDPGGGDNTLLNPVALHRDFRDAYMSSGRSVGEKNFAVFPLPNWRINWTGIENMIPFIGQSMQRATLTHAYEGLYRIGWNLNNNPGDLITRRVGVFTVEDERFEFEPSTVNIEKRFAPLIQLNVTWLNGLRTQVGYETSNITSLSLANSQVIERLSKGLRFSIAYTLRNFKIPFVRRTASNVDLTLNGSVIDDTEQRFRLDADLDGALQNDASVIDRNPDAYSFNPGNIYGQSRINASAVVGYRFSNTIQANFEYAFSQILPKSSGTFKRTTHDIRFSIRINIRST
ncbi:T9SS outer membrane translocon Sov/SprA [Rhodohalobacter sp. 614A]|uniref:T9SS outer membrane translocon Sov/SprA n=1 Tax=Rhodohalobacter sp. 614A TaxID=2908649 RepID=UPI001F1D5AF0